MSRLLDLVRQVLDPRARLGSDTDWLPQTVQQDAVDGRQRMPLWKIWLGNPPLLLGTLLVLGLFAMTLFGPTWAAQNPYLSAQPITRHYDADLKVLVDPPLPPSEEFPFGTDRWGMDLLSLLLYGARNTLVACVFIASVRVLLGVLLGGLAGWNEGRLVDQLTMGAVGVVTAVPILISSLFLIYALDIRRGLLTFIIALSLVGWTEIAQYIRGEFLVLRNKPFIEGARSSGMGSFSIAVRQILPNLLEHLLVLSFLEMGAVMMLLGELGFIGVYIGGGTRVGIEVELFTQQVFQLVEIPEWGAMLAEGFRYLRSKPFVVFPPAAAFFVAVVGFNTLGDGLRRHLETYGLNTGILLRKRSLLFFAGIAAATVFIINHTGPTPWFEKVAEAFDGKSAYEQAMAFANMGGRGHGQQGIKVALDDIVSAVETYGLQPGWKHNEYLYDLPASLVRPIKDPVLELVGPEGGVKRAFIHQNDFAYIIDGHGGSGSALGAITFIGFTSNLPPEQEAYDGLDLRGRIVMLQEGNAPSAFASEAQIRGAQAIIWITAREEMTLHSQILKLEQDEPGLLQPQIPIYRVRPSTARALLEPDSLELAELFEQPGSTTTRGWFRCDLSGTARIELQLQNPEPYMVRNVLAYLPGSDFDNAAELLVLFAAYDGLGTDPDGKVFPAANNDGSGVAVLLELARLWQEQGLQPRRPVLFVFWGTGTMDEAGVIDFIHERSHFTHLPSANEQVRVEPSVVFQLSGVGAGGELLQVAGQPGRYLDVLEETAGELELDFYLAGAGKETIRTTSGKRVSWIQLGWIDSELPPEADTGDKLDRDRFSRFGEFLALTMAKLVRQTEY